MILSNSDSIQTYLCSTCTTSIVFGSALATWELSKLYLLVIVIYIPEKEKNLARASYALFSYVYSAYVEGRTLK